MTYDTYMTEEESECCKFHPQQSKDCTFCELDRLVDLQDDLSLEK